MKFCGQYSREDNINSIKPKKIMGKVLKDCPTNNSIVQIGGPLSAVSMNVASNEKLCSAEPISIGKDSPQDGVKKKMPILLRKTVEEELCKICGDRASGYHYNALSCEGCKGFFRRSITRNAVYNCKYGGHCEMDMWMRRKCPACRLLRCREVGMKQECLLSDDQCKARDARRKAKQKMNKKESRYHDTKASPSTSSEGYSEESSDETKYIFQSPVSIKDKDPLSKLSQEEQNLINDLVYYQEKFEYPEEAYMASIGEQTNMKDIKNEKELRSNLLDQMVLMCVAMTRLVVEFAKQLPGFQQLPKEDQIVLLKEASSEVAALRSSRCYDSKTKSIIFTTGIALSKENMSALGINNYADVAFNFFHSLVNLCVDNAEYALLTAICIFSDRPGLVKPDQVEKFQEKFVSALYSYENHKRSNGGCSFAIMLSRITELRTLSLKHSEDLLELDMGSMPIPELVKEFFCIERDFVKKKS